jgi:hypothetical protein
MYCVLSEYIRAMYVSRIMALCLFRNPIPNEKFRIATDIKDCFQATSYNCTFPVKAFSGLRAPLQAV